MTKKSILKEIHEFYNTFGCSDSRRAVIGRGTAVTMLQALLLPGKTIVMTYEESDWMRHHGTDMRDLGLSFKV